MCIGKYLQQISHFQQLYKERIVQIEKQIKNQQNILHYKDGVVLLMQRELALLYKYTEAWNGCMFNWKDYMILNIDEMKTTCPWAIVKDTKK